MEVFDARDFESLGLPVTWPHDSVSCSISPGTIRGLHYQAPPFAQAKLVTVAFGRVFDVMVDLRPDSQTYIQHSVIELFPGKAVLVPEGFAHGYCTLVRNSIVMYKMTNVYSQAHAKGIRWDDPALGIDWPEVASNPVVSRRDLSHPPVHQATEFRQS